MQMKRTTKTIRQPPTSNCPMIRRHTPSSKNPTAKLTVAILNKVRAASSDHRGYVLTAAICNNSADRTLKMKNRKAIDNRVWTRPHSSHVVSALGTANTDPPVSPAANVAIVVRDTESASSVS
jgi:hypothetical protein